HAMHEVKKEAIAMKEALLVGNIERFARVMNRGWEAKKKTASKVTNPEIDRIYELALGSGAYAGKISGAGGGGFMILVTNPLERLKLVETLQKNTGTVYLAQFTKQGAKSWKV
ncbi:MAG: dehydrogenase, partial [Desulfomonilaceae bacterium]